MKTPSSSSASRTVHHHHLYYHSSSANGRIFSFYVLGGFSFVCGVIYLSLHYLIERYCPVPVINLQEMNWNYIFNSQQQNVPSAQTDQPTEDLEGSYPSPLSLHAANFQLRQANPQPLRYRRNVQNG